MEEKNAVLAGIFLVGMILISIISIGCLYSYEKSLRGYENFENTIKDLSEEQKCLHICGFRYPYTTYFENYKFCVEKCDRISERNCKE